MRRSLAVLAMMPLLMANQCYPAFDVRTSPGPSPQQPLFTGERGGQPVELLDLSVTQCRPSVVSHLMWQAAITGDSVVYGQGTENGKSKNAAEPLRPDGCYEVFAGGRLRTGERAIGHGGFHVRADGTVANGTGPRGRHLTSERDVDRAAVDCRRAYRRARTAADSSTVDARVRPVSDTSVTCGYLRARHPAVLAEAESSEKLLLQAAGGLVAIAALIALQNALPHQ